MKWLVLELAPRLSLGLAMITLLLAAGCACCAWVKSAVHRQRIGELTVAGVLGWILLAALPLPRYWPAANTTKNEPSYAATVGSAQTGSYAIHSAFPVALSADGSVSPTLNEPIPRARPPAEADVCTFASANVGASGDPRISHARSTGNAAEGEATASSATEPDRQDAATAVSAIVGQTMDRPAEPKAEFGWVALAAELYLGAAAIGAGWLIAGHILLIRERWTAESPPPWLYRILQSATAHWPGPLPRLLVSRRCSRPLACGMWRPMIVLPERLCGVENREQLKAILLHELAHIRRGDARGNLLFEAAFPLLLVHPLYWWLRSQTRLAAELVADDWAARRAGKEIYIMELVRLARSSVPGRAPVMAATSVFISPSQFYRRMQMLLTRENPLATRTSRLWKFGSLVGLALCVALATALGGTGPAIAQQPVYKAADAPRTTSDAPKLELTPAIEAAPQRDAPFAASGAPTAPATEGLVQAVPAATPPLTGPSAAPTPPLALGDVKVENPAAIADEIRQLQARLQLLETHAHAAAGIAAVGLVPPKPVATRPARAFKTVKDVDGADWMYIYELMPDGSIGRVIETRRLPTAADKQRPGEGQRGIALRWEVMGPTAAGNQQEGGQPGAPPASPIPDDVVHLSGRPLDLVSLATNYSDAVTAVELAKIHRSNLEKVVNGHSASEGDLLSARALVQAAERKEQLLRRIVNVALASARQELDRSVALHSQGAVTGEALTEVQSRVDVLQQILNIGSAGTENSKPTAPLER
jgi:beta-lactamase regulating signal transducer with metallopeptidase domain